jgi:hypothetical protein
LAKVSIVKAMLVGLLSLASWPLLAQQATVRVEPTKLQGPRTLEKQTEAAVVRDYVKSWQSLSAALEQNRPELLDQSFVGTALDELTETAHQQAALGMRTRYQDHAHDVRVVFYSPEGLSIQLIDDVDYDQQVWEHDKLLTTQRVHARYLVVLTPTEVQWRVRLLQGF